MATAETLLREFHDLYVAAWMRGDREAAMTFWAEDIVMRSPGTNPHSGTFRGKSKVKRQLIDRLYAETSKVQVLQVEDRVVSRSHIATVLHARFEKPDGRVFETHRIVIYQWDEGKITEVSYFDPDQAVADAFWTDTPRS